MSGKLLSAEKLRYVYLLLAFALATVVIFSYLTFDTLGTPQHIPDLDSDYRYSVTLWALLVLTPFFCTGLLCLVRASLRVHCALFVWSTVLDAVCALNYEIPLEAVFPPGEREDLIYIRAICFVACQLLTLVVFRIKWEGKHMGREDRTEWRPRLERILWLPAGRQANPPKWAAHFQAIACLAALIFCLQVPYLPPLRVQNPWPVYHTYSLVMLRGFEIYSALLFLFVIYHRSCNWLVVVAVLVISLTISMSFQIMQTISPYSWAFLYGDFIHAIFNLWTCIPFAVLVCKGFSWLMKTLTHGFRRRNRPV